jgi:hypothetical protein
VVGSPHQLKSAKLLFLIGRIWVHLCCLHDGCQLVFIEVQAKPQLHDHIYDFGDLAAALTGMQTHQKPSPGQVMLNLSQNGVAVVGMEHCKGAAEEAGGWRGRRLP